MKEDSYPVRVCERSLARSDVFSSAGIRGSIGLGSLILLCAFFAALYSAWHIVPIYYRYYEILGTVRGQVKVYEPRRESKVRAKILSRIRELGIPLENERYLQIVKMGDRVRIELDYSEVFNVDLGEGRVYEVYVFEFHPMAEANFVDR